MANNDSNYNPNIPNHFLGGSNKQVIGVARAPKLKYITMTRDQWKGTSVGDKIFVPGFHNSGKEEVYNIQVYGSNDGFDIKQALAEFVVTVFDYKKPLPIKQTEFWTCQVISGGKAQIKLIRTNEPTRYFFVITGGRSDMIWEIIST